MKHFEDNFAQFHLPDKQFQPDYLLNHPDFHLEDQLNCVEKLLDSHIKEGRGNSIAIQTLESHKFGTHFGTHFSRIQWHKWNGVGMLNLIRIAAKGIFK